MRGQAKWKTYARRTPTSLAPTALTSALEVKVRTCPNQLCGTPRPQATRRPKATALRNRPKINRLGARRRQPVEATNGDTGGASEEEPACVPEGKPSRGLKTNRFGRSKANLSTRSDTNRANGATNTQGAQIPNAVPGFRLCGAQVEEENSPR